MLEELSRDEAAVGAPNDLQSFWQPFTPNRQFKAHPRLVVSARGMHYRSHDGRDVLDSSAGLWCANLGHCHPKVVEAVQQGIATLDFAPTFQFGHNKVFELASRVADAMPGDLEPRVLLQLGLGSGRYRAEDRARLSPRARRRPALPADRARARLSRGRLRRHVGRRHGREPAHLRADAAGRRSPAPHPRSRAQRVHARPARARPGARRRSRAPVRAARPLDHRRGDRRAGRGLDRRLSAARRLSGAPARDLRQARHPSDLRRGDHRLGASWATPRPPSASASCPT